MAAAATAKQILYHPPQTLLPRRKDSIPTSTSPVSGLPPRGAAQALTMTIPFSFSSRLSRLDSRRQTLLSAASSQASIRRAGSTPRHTALTPGGPQRSGTTTPRMPSLPRLTPSHSLNQTQGHIQGRPPVPHHGTPRSKLRQRSPPMVHGAATPRSRISQTKPGPIRRSSQQTLRSMATTAATNTRSAHTPCSGSEVRRTSSGYWGEEASLEDRERVEVEEVEGEEEVKRRKEEGGDDEGCEEDVSEGEGEGWVDWEVRLSPQEERERRMNEAKCQQWLQGLPQRFSSMHVVQHVVHNEGQ